MKREPFASMVMITVVAIGVFIWFASDRNYNSSVVIPSALSVLYALVFTILTQVEQKKIVLATTIGAIIAIVINFFIDWYFDPTSHNLLPFEFIIDVVGVMFASIIGVAIGSIYRWLKKKKSYQ